MNDLPIQHHRAGRKAKRPLTQPEQTNQELLQQIADYQQEVERLQSALQEAQILVTQHGQFEAEQRRLLAQERELKSNFINLASHEFRTPMMTILTSASLINRYNSSEESDNRERHVQRIKAAVTNLTAMLNEFLAVSQVDQYALRSTSQSLELTAFCQDVIASVKATAKPRQRFNYQPQTGSLEVCLDSQLLKSILFNLLTNASKYSADDMPIQLISAIQNRHIVFTIIDQGIGIPDLDKDKVFTNFFRSRNAIHVQGTGLGLYLAKHYAELLGGTITFTSEVGKGTSFTVQLPLMSERA
ncbi:sensor histidine kinase [Spirosoma sp. KUDC1026]|uniref:sensor histidine kinase n=1 Tax=Spirosoma sp. KUDC1026 TaxID=2745947 RepID=UPI00159BB65B|nr:HAMP domain-containing sensor histidine kinase [Spirosoma sp. KUDC1026]QKZ13812.1 HAMP domain-containing histidine kinase [Spirosoma sp. KUDC1026]